MRREWTDVRDGKGWRVEAIPLGQRMEAGSRIAMMTETPWRLSFEARDAVHDGSVDYEVGSGVEALSNRDLERLLDAFRGEAVIDVDGECVRFHIGSGEQFVAVPLDYDPGKVPPLRLMLLGRTTTTRTLLADPAPKERIEEYEADELRNLWRQRSK